MSNMRVVCRGLQIENDLPEEQNPKPAPAEHFPDIVKSKERTSSPDGIANRELLLDKAGAELTGQIEASRYVDAKVGVIVGFALLVLVQVVGAVWKVSDNELTLFKLHLPLLYLLGLLFFGALAATLLATCFGMLALEPRRMARPSVAPALVNPDMPREELLRGCLQGLASAMDRNEEILQGKLRQSRCAAFAVGAALICYLGMSFTLLLMLVLRH